jgi:hypothetical protein
MKPLPITPDLLPKMQALKQDEAFQYLMAIIENWREQAMSELAVMEDVSKMKDAQADYRTCSKILQLPDRIIQDLQTRSDLSMEDFDPYQK